MAQLRMSIVVPAPVEKVYEYVTAHGPEGPVDEEQFRQRYAENIRRTADGYVYTEDVRRHPDNPEQIITWRCTFAYPNRRFIIAVDSNWSHRRDDFEPLTDATLWTVQWSTHGGWVQGIIQLLIFKIRRSKAIRREVLDPVRLHFEAD